MQSRSFSAGVKWSVSDGESYIIFNFPLALPGSFSAIHHEQGLAAVQTLTGVNTQELVSIWQTLGQDIQNYRGRRVFIRYHPVLLSQQLHLNHGTQSIFSCSMAEREITLGHWKIQYYYDAGYCLSIPNPLDFLCNREIQIPWIYLILGSGLFILVVFRKGLNRKSLWFL